MVDSRTAPVLVLGSGFAAFGAGHTLEAAGRPYVAVDKNDWFGGHTASYAQPEGWVFDDGPHVSFTKNERVQEILAAAVDGAYESVPIQLNNYWNGLWLTHPVQVNLHGLPTDLITRILVDFVEAQQASERPIADYDEWCRVAFGTTFAETFPLVYGKKYHTTGAENLTTDWLGPRMYRPSLEEILRGALAPAPITDVHYVTHFRYPSYGGYASYLRSWAQGADLRLGHEVVEVDPAAKTVQFADGRTLDYDRLVSSMPLPELIRCLPAAPERVAEAAERLAYTSVVMTNLGIERPDITQAHVSYFYDEDVLFSRLSFPHKLSPHTVPAGTSAIQAEVYVSDKYKPLDQPLDAIADRVVDDLHRTGVLRDDDRILFREVRVARYGNVIYDHNRADALATIHAYLDEVGILYCGRYGDWNHEWTDEAFVSGEEAAKRAVDGG